MAPLTNCPRVGFNPDIQIFKPAGITLTEFDEVALGLEELEYSQGADRGSNAHIKGRQRDM
jgi:predicted DNA-binding protein (UPF0251 family)